jgi:hypothetical protein
VSARRCSLHGINYPFNQYHCPVCKAAGFEDTATSYIEDEETDEDWQARSKQLIRGMEEAAEEQDLIPTLEAHVRHEAGYYFIEARDVIRSGIWQRLKPLDLFRVGNQVFEVEVYVESWREYAVRPFSLELSDDDLRRLASGG